MAVPEDLYYTEEHEWVALEGDVATLGITSYAQKQLGDIVFVELPEVDAELAPGDVLATIESVKAASEIYSPLAGKVLEINDDLTDNAATINSDPYGEGWIARITITDVSVVEDLMDPATYAENIAGDED
jgi:glycine cleavage system H protein